MKKAYLIANNDKRFAKWVNETSNKLKGDAKNTFVYNANEVRYGNYFARASFVAYWNIHFDNSMARFAPAITQATLIHMMHRFLERGKTEEVEIINQMTVNYLRLIKELDDDEEE